jgi:hypothetical protein
LVLPRGIDLLRDWNDHQYGEVMSAIDHNQFLILLALYFGFVVSAVFHPRAGFLGAALIALVYYVSGLFQVVSP